MKFPNFKKYFFAHVIVVLFYIMLGSFTWAIWLNSHYPSEEYSFYGEPGAYIWSPGDPQMFLGIACIICAWFVIALTIVEILFRKFVIEKYFPNLKLPFSIKLPKWLCVTHSIFFYFGLIPMICIDIYFEILGIINILQYYMN